MKDLLNKIHLGDCLEFMKQLPDKCIDLVLTDPPYSGSVCRTGGRTSRYESGERLQVSRTGGTWAEKYGKKVAEWDKAPAQEVFDELFRVSKHQIIWGGNYFNLPPTRCFNDNAKFWEYMPQDSCRFHPTQKPVDLIMRQLEEYAEPWMVIFDPFSGSGTIAIACHNLGLDFICVERDPDYHAASVARLNKHREQMLLPLG